MNEPLLLDPSSVASSLLALPEAPPPAPVPSAEDLVDGAHRKFDPTRHKSKPDGTPFVNKYGFFMPIGGKRSRSTPAPVAQPAAASTPPAQEPNAAAASIPPKPPEAEKPAWGPAAHAAAAGVDFTPQPERTETPPPAPGTPTPPPAAAPGIDNSEEAAEVGTRALYFTVGILIGSPEEATLDKAEHANFHRAAAAYIRSTGWKGTPLTCLVLMVCAYLLRTFQKPVAAAQVKKWLADFKAKKKPPVPVQPSAPAAGVAQQANASLKPRFVERAA
jgi:hypothetical protein